MIKILPFIPHYVSTKIKSTEYFNVIESDLYSVNSFNEYGDVYTHWGMESVEFPPTLISGEFNPTTMKEIKEFKAQVEKVNAIFTVSYPGFHDDSYLICLEKIERIAQEYERNGFAVLGDPERYMLPDDMMFNTAYHLNKGGVDYRTRLLIEDLYEYNAP